MSAEPRSKQPRKAMEPAPFTDAESARVFCGIIRGESPPDEKARKRHGLHWRDGFLIVESDHASGERRWLENVAVNDPSTAARCRSAIEAARAEPPQLGIAKETTDDLDEESDRPPDARPTIICGAESRTEGLKSWTPKALKALVDMNRRKPVIFQRGGMLVRLRHPNKDMTPSIEPLCLDGLRGQMDRSAFYANEIITRTGPKNKFGPPRLEIAKDILSLGDDALGEFPALDIVAESPRFASDGELILTPGYHPGSRMYYSPPPVLCGMSVSLRPTRAELDHSKRLILDELLHDFSFANQASRANAVACMLSPFVRLMIQGPTPNHHFTASTEGTGKGLCAAACAFPYLGRQPDLTAQKETEAEWRKAFTSHAMSGAPFFFVDNMYNPKGWDDVPLPVDSGTLAMAWTSLYYVDRILGGNKEARIKILSIFMSAGNNVDFSRELRRRLVLIELMALDEIPSLRTGFKHDPLMTYAAENRLELTKACLTLCRHWIAEGRPLGTQVMGSYESYVQTMGGILGACGVDGFLANQPKAVKRDPESGRWRMLVEQWNESGGSPSTTADLWKLINSKSGLTELFAERLGTGGEQSQKIRLGKALEMHEGRVWGEFRVTRAQFKAANKGIVWKLIPKEAEWGESEESETVDAS
jgi:hypothetical protein